MGDDLFWETFAKKGAALRVGDMKILINVPNVMWIKPPELEDSLTERREMELQSSSEDHSGEMKSYLSLVSCFFFATCSFAFHLNCAKRE